MGRACKFFPELWAKQIAGAVELPNRQRPDICLSPAARSREN